jgi:putative secretion ATPase (PEP-CTERM system associated)
MYESFFHLREKPFDIVPDPAYLFRSRTHKQSMNYVRYGLQERLGYVLMTGEVGSGKTLVVRELVRTMGREFTFSRIFNTRLNSQELLAMANEDFGLDTAGKGKVQLLKDLYSFLIEENEAGRKPVLIIDEAQNLSLDLLEEVRMLSNFETSYTKLLQIVLVGQPELGRVLSLPEMRQFRQRIGISCRILPLTRQETEEYIRHRLSVAGNSDAVSFTEESLESIHKYTGGIPRQINTLCNFLLLTAFTEERQDINGKMVRDVAQGIGISTPERAESSCGPPDRLVAGESGRGCTTGRRVLLKALGADLQDDSVASAAEQHSGATDTDGEYPPAIRAIGSRLQAMDNDRENMDNDGSSTFRQRRNFPGNSRAETGWRRGAPDGWGRSSAGTNPREDENADNDKI